MAIIEKQTPHEFLCRWDDAGNLQGAHIAYRTAYVDDSTNTEVTSKFGDPQPVDLTNGTLLSQISADINQAALADGTAKAAQITDLQNQLATAQAAQTQALSDRDAAQAQVQTLQAQIQELQPQPVNGVPQQVTKRQGVQALINTGHYASVQPAINAIADATQRATFQNEWDNSTSFMRQRPSLIALGTAIGLTSTDLDNLFILAATL